MIDRKDADETITNDVLPPSPLTEMWNVKFDGRCYPSLAGQSQGQHDFREPTEFDQAVEQVWCIREIVGTQDVDRGLIDAGSE